MYKRVRLATSQVVTRLRIADWKIPASHGFHLPFLVLATCGCVFWYLRPPMPNKAVLAIGVVAVIMTLTEMRPAHKAAWLIIVFALAFLENRAIDKDRVENEKARAEIRNQENTQFQTIADGIAGSMTANQKAFDVTVSHLINLTGISKQTLAEETGGDSFIYFLAVPNLGVGHPPTYPMVAFVKGHYPMRNVVAQIQTVVEGNGFNSLERAIASMHQLPLGNGTMALGPVEVNERVSLGKYIISIWSLNGDEHETMELKLNNGQLDQFITVMKNGKILYKLSGG